MLTLAAAQEAPRGWGGPVAILAAVVVFYLFATTHQRIRDARRTPSPTPRGGRGVRVKPQVRSVSDTDNTTPDTTDDTDAETDWWGRIVEVGGRRFRQARQIMRTGALDDEDDEFEHADDDVDLALDDEPETMEEAIARMDEAGVPYAEIVRAVMRDYEVSESTAKRRIRDVRASEAA